MEDEIKIEYYESYEPDPLSEDAYVQNVAPSEINVTSFEVQESGNNDDIIIHNSQEIENIFLNNTPVVEENKNEDNNTNSEKEHWYKSIDNTGRYVCKFCDLPYSTVQSLRRHSLTKHPNDASKLKLLISKNIRRINKCHICNKKYDTFENLQNHLLTEHSVINTQFCHKCQAMFDDKLRLLDHLKTVHKLIGTQVYACLACGYKTSKISHFKQHQWNHLQYKRHKCHYCNYATNSTSNLRIHERIHEKTNKPYKCNNKDCNYSSATRSAMRSHELTHNKEKNFIYCDKCTYKTVYKQSLKKHIDSHNRNTVKTVF